MSDLPGTISQAVAEAAAEFMRTRTAIACGALPSKLRVLSLDCQTPDFDHEVVVALAACVDEL
jgi:hypothetical protein